MHAPCKPLPSLPFPPDGKPRLVLGAFTIVAVTVLAYGPALRAGFIWDDDIYVTDNHLLTDTDGLRRIWCEVGATPQYYPLVHTSFWIEHHLWGLAPAGYHATNVLLHAGGALLLWAILRRLAVPGAWMAAAVFAVHPVHVESVAWVTERKNVLSGVFYLASLLAYLHFIGIASAREGSVGTWRNYALALLLFACALLSKTVTCSLPAVILLLVWWKRARIGWRDVRPLLPMFVLGAGLGLVTVWLERHHVGARGAEWDLSLADRCLIAGRAVWFYAGKLVWPAKLTFIYPRWQVDGASAWEYVIPLAALFVVAALWLLRKKAGRGHLVAVLCFIGSLGPALGFVDVYPMRYSFVADHFQYLASIGLIVLFVAIGVTRARSVMTSCSGTTREPRPLQRSPEIMLCAVVLITLTTTTWRQVHAYVDLKTLWTDTLAKNPSAWIAHNNLGIILAAEGKTEQAKAHYGQALNLKSDHPEAHNNLGAILAQEGSIDEAIQHIQAAIRYKPDYLEAYNNLGNVLTDRGRLAEAVACYDQALKILPGSAELHYNLADTLELQGSTVEAIDHFQAALKLQPVFPEAHRALGRLYAGHNQVELAIHHYQMALRASPDEAGYWQEFGNLCARAGRMEEARAGYQQALRLNPTSAAAYNGLGMLAARKGSLEVAMDCFHSALQVDPRSDAGHYNLANALMQNGRSADAVTHYREALAINPKSGLIANRLAWILATASDSNVRNGAEAVVLAESNCPAEKCSNADFLDTLAAAYAEMNRFGEAAESADRAVQAAIGAQSPELAFRIKQRLNLYRSGKACHEGGLP